MAVTSQIGEGVYVVDSREILNNNFSAVDSALDTKVDSGNVLTNVPSGATFTDTIYVHPDGDGYLHVIVSNGLYSGYSLKAGSTAGSLSWTLINKSYLGLGNVDNTSDLNKPISSAQQAALNLKASTSSPTFTGTVSATTFNGDLTGNASTATKIYQDDSGNVITSTYLKLSVTTHSFTGSTRTSLTPVLNSYFPTAYSVTLLNQSTGIASGSYTLQSILQALVAKDHSHELVSRRGNDCNCNCDCSDSS